MDDTTPTGASSSPARPVLLRSDEQFRLLVEGVQDYAIFMLDPTGHVATWNEGAARIKGYAASEIIGQHFSRFYPPAAVAQRWPDQELQMASGPMGRFEDEGWRVRKDGTRFWANVVITAVRDRDGTLIGFSKITRDLTERRRQEDTVRRSEERLRLMIEAVQDYAILILDPQGRVASWNTGAERINGYKAEEIIGQHFSRFYPAHVVAEGFPEFELRTALKEGRFEDEGWRVRKDGRQFWASVVITPVRDKEGTLLGYTKITRDLSERRRVQELETGTRQMSEFLAMLGHELRNPLAPIRNALGVLEVRPDADERARTARDIIDRQVEHLTRLVDDLLDVGRITSGKISLRRERVELAAVATRAVEGSRPLLDERRHALEVSLPDEPVVVEGDETRLAQVVLNLLNNAAKYTPPGGHIRLRARVEEGRAVMRVRDDGMGIPADLLPRVFDLFAQGERTLERSEGGLGVGLTLVRRLVEMHGGSVEARSDGPGRGSEFVVRLPLAGAADAEHGPEAGEPATQHPSASRRVLVVDDNADSAESMCLLLEMWGHEARATRDGEEAIKIAAEMRPQLILLDIGLPGMDGYEVARRLRQIPELQGTVLAAMTGYGQDEDRRRSQEAGFAHHLVKPVQVHTLQEVFAQLR
jgi:PAS domain S-box-containing protein